MERGINMNINRLSFVNFNSLKRPVNNKQEENPSKKPVDNKPVDDSNSMKKIGKQPINERYTTMALGEEGGSRYPNVSEF